LVDVSIDREDRRGAPGEITVGLALTPAPRCSQLVPLLATPDPDGPWPQPTQSSHGEADPGRNLSVDLAMQRRWQRRLVGVEG
jgi:hypothetical protein